MKFKIENESHAYRWMEIFMYLSLDTCPKFIDYCHLPFAYDNKLQQFARRCIRVYEDANERPKIMYENNLFEQIYEDGRNSLGTNKIDALIEWGDDKIPIGWKAGQSCSKWWRDLLRPLIIIDSLGEEIKLSDDSLNTLKTIIQKYDTKVRKERLMPFDEIEAQEQSEWDKKIDRIYSMVRFCPDDILLSILDIPWILIDFLIAMDAWHEITQTLGTDDLQTLQTWIVQRAKSSKYKNWEKWLDFELIKQHQIEFYPKN